ncbi:helix-turn-helix domain-containing protein [Sphingomonas crocodyli]|uniref:Transcriptional regulator n=1 Tax=Sphingomonas crocodyli TaxID=1979270 RepID=A0A437LYQ3_9SPHN|nr:helix-turn-helix domain-containing protein [Sphingomonas crocodyli]RVT90476.1 transcriptional regulator [Sphingomonas crocodyli]
MALSYGQADAGQRMKVGENMGSSRPDRASGTQKARAGVKSCLRTVEVINFFMGVSAPVRTTKVSEALGIPNSSADEILRTLSVSGFLSYNAVSKLYSPSYKLVANVRTIERNFFGEDAIAGLMADLRAETGATVIVTQQNDCWVDPVALVTGDWVEQDERYPAEMVCHVGNMWRPSTNFAAAMLTRHSNVQLADLTMRTQQMGIGPDGPSMFEALVDKVERTRARGYAVHRRNGASPVDSIAIPLIVTHAASPHAIGVVGPRLFSCEADEKRIARTVQQVTSRHLDRLNGVSATAH